MKILIVNIVCGILSTGRMCTDIAERLESQGHEVKIAYGRGMVPEQYRKYAVRIGSMVDVSLHGMRARLFDDAGFGSKAATEKLIEWIKEYDPDVIHLHNIHGYYIDIDALFSYLKTCGKRIIWTLHDCWAFTGHCVHFEDVGCEKWKSGCFDCPQKREYPRSWFFDSSAKNYERKKKVFQGVPNLVLVTPSSWLASLIPYSFLKDYPIKVIQNGIDLSSFRNIPSNLNKKAGLENKRVILGVAQNWEAKKGLSDFLKLSVLLPEQYSVVLVGFSKKQLRKLPKGILGILKTESKTELAKWYSAADVFVNFTYQDTFPTVNIEALACGTPVLSYDTGGSSEMLTENCGWVISQGDVKDAAELLQKIPTKEKYSEACEKQAKKFDRDVNNEEYIRLYFGDL